MRRSSSATEESRMKLSTRYAIFVFAATCVAAAVTFSSAPTSAQDDGWQIVRAEYGTRTQHNDVTDIVRDLVGRGGVNGRVAVNNQTMGGDPAVGAEKHLRIRARNRKYGEREFDYREGGFVEVATFAVRRDRGDWNDRPDNYGDRDRDGEISFVVRNSAMGGDPAVGADKVLVVIYSYQGTEKAAIVREGYTLTLP